MNPSGSMPPVGFNKHNVNANFKWNKENFHFAQKQQRERRENIAGEVARITTLHGPQASKKQEVKKSLSF